MEQSFAQAGIRLDRYDITVKTAITNATAMAYGIQCGRAKKKLFEIISFTGVTGASRSPSFHSIDPIVAGSCLERDPYRSAPENYVPQLSEATLH